MLEYFHFIIKNMALFDKQKVPVISSIEELKQFVEEYPNHKFCLYLSYKQSDAWDKSTSRVYMNQVSEYLIYLPINVSKGDNATIAEAYELSEKNDQIIAIHQTQPHKSYPVGK